ncbi:MAG: hypothetical protein L0219_18620, partial [Phycisphaerales bacterium]|nr:hypothetical protein [Phycisphaerales bacterium]
MDLIRPRAGALRTYLPLQRLEHRCGIITHGEDGLAEPVEHITIKVPLILRGLFGQLLHLRD